MSLAVVPAIADVVVCHMSLMWMSSVLQVLVVGGGWVGVFGYDVPGVEEAGDET